MDYYRIGQKIRKYRKALNMSQEKLVEIVNISAMYMSRLCIATLQIHDCTVWKFKNFANGFKKLICNKNGILLRMPAAHVTTYSSNAQTSCTVSRRTATVALPLCNITMGGRGKRL